MTNPIFPTSEYFDSPPELPTVQPDAATQVAAAVAAHPELHAVLARDMRESVIVGLDDDGVGIFALELLVKAGITFPGLIVLDWTPVVQAVWEVVG
jgi:hypothetical protein